MPDNVVADSGKPSDETRQSAQRSPRRRKWLRILLGVLGLWLIGDFSYSRYVQYRISQWEESVPWTDEGLSPDAEPKTYIPRNSPEALESNEVGPSKALLLVHGFGDSPQIYRKLAPALAERGFLCQSILLPGFGRNVDAYAKSTKEQWLEHLERELTDLKAQSEEVWIVAHSLGGALTIHHVLNDPQSVDGIVFARACCGGFQLSEPDFPNSFLA